MNEQDTDRMNSKMQRSNVVDLNAYRAAAQARTGASYIDPIMQRWLSIGALIIACVLIALRIVR